MNVLTFSSPDAMFDAMFVRDIGDNHITKCRQHKWLAETTLAYDKAGDAVMKYARQMIERERAGK